MPDVEEARAELEAKGVVFDGDILDTGVCHMAFFRDPDGNALMLHRRYAPPCMTTLTREQAAKRFAELPLPSTKDEHWRFTEPARLRPCPNGHGRGQTPAASRPAMLDLDVAARALVTESGIEILERARGRALRAAAARLRRRR